MINIEMYETETREDMAYQLEYIAKLIREGYTSGIDPTWSIEGDEEKDE